MAVYIVFDVETPNRANDRMSAIGITAVKDNKIVANYFSLVDPETHFDSFNTQLTGIDAEKVKGAPNFAELRYYMETECGIPPIVEYTGFTDNEVRDKCAEYEISLKKMKQWYDGYHVNGVSIYNPKSVVESILRKNFFQCGRCTDSSRPSGISQL